MSQRELAAASGVSQSLVARLERGLVPAGLRELVTVLDAIGFTLVLNHGGSAGSCGCPDGPGDPEPRAGPDGVPSACAGWTEDGQVRYRDEGGRAFPAHGKAGWAQMPPLYWQFRRGWPWPHEGAMLWHYRGRSPAVRRWAAVGAGEGGGIRPGTM